MKNIVLLQSFKRNVFVFQSLITFFITNSFNRFANVENFGSVSWKKLIVLEFFKLIFTIFKQKFLRLFFFSKSVFFSISISKLKH